MLKFVSSQVWMKPSLTKSLRPTRLWIFGWIEVWVIMKFDQRKMLKELELRQLNLSLFHSPAT